MLIASQSPASASPRTQPWSAVAAMTASGKISLINSRLWDVFKGSCLKTMNMEKTPPLNNVSFTSGYDKVLVSSMNNSIQLIDLNSSEYLIRYTGHSHSKYLMDVRNVFIGDECYLVSGSEDGRICYWNVEDGGDCSSYYLGKEKGNNNAIVNLAVNSRNDMMVCSSLGMSSYSLINVGSANK